MTQLTISLGFTGNLNVFISEINEFYLRAVGITLFGLGQQIISLIFQYATSVGLERLGWKYFCIFIPWIAVVSH